MKPKVGDRVVYYTGNLEGTIVAVSGVLFTYVNVKWDNGAPDLGPYVLGMEYSSVRLK